MQTKKLLIYLARSYSANVFFSLFVFNGRLSSPRCSESNVHMFTKISGIVVRYKGLFNTLSFWISQGTMPWQPTEVKKSAFM